MRDGYCPLWLRKEDDLTRIQINENYSVAVKRFIGRPNNVLFLLDRITITIRDDDNDYGKYGNIPTLSNGLRLQIENYQTGVVLCDLLDGQVIQSVADWISAGFHLVPVNDSGNATRLTQLTKAFPAVPIHGRDAEQIALLANDNFDQIEKHTVLLELRQSRF